MIATLVSDFTNALEDKIFQQSVVVLNINTLSQKHTVSFLVLITVANISHLVSAFETKAAYRSVCCNSDQL